MKEHVVPFALGAILAGLGAASAEGVRKRIIEYSSKLQVDESKAEALVVWSADAAQTFVATASPLITGLLLVGGTTSTLGVAYAGLTVVGLLLFLKVLFVRPDVYSSRRFLKLTAVPWLGIGINVVLGALVQILS